MNMFYHVKKDKQQKYVIVTDIKSTLKPTLFNTQKYKVKIMENFVR